MIYVLAIFTPFIILFFIFFLIFFFAKANGSFKKLSKAQTNGTYNDKLDVSKVNLSESPFDEYDFNDDSVKDIIKKKLPSTSFTGKGYLTNSKGVDIAQFSFIDSKLNGPSKYYYDNGNLLKEKNYLNEKLDGSYLVYFPDGTKMYECTLKNGERINSSTSYYSTGEIRKTVKFDTDQNSGTFNEYYKNGNLKRKGSLIRIAVDDEPYYALEGPCEEYYKDSGKVFYRINFDNEKDDYFQSITGFYENGDLLFEYDGQRYKRYDQQGKLIKDFIFKNDTLEKAIVGKAGSSDKDIFLLIDKDAILATGSEDTSDFIFDSQIDCDDYLYELNNFDDTIDMEFSEISLSARFEFSSADKISKLKNIKQVTNVISNLENKKLSISATEQLQNGSFTEKYPDGMIKRSGFYKNGKLDSYYTEYHANGRIKAVGYYRDGEKIGNWEYYNEDGSKNTNI